MPFASRLTDNHACSIHGGGPILPPGSSNVLIGGLPAARVTDPAACGYSPDALVMGSETVLINGLPAARFGDLTAHGGLIIAGCVTVDVGGPSAAFPFSLPGPPSAVEKIQEALAILYDTAAGRELMQRIASAQKNVVIEITEGGSECEALDATQVRPGGKGSDSIVRWNPVQTLDLPSDDPRSGAVILGHELVHAEHNATATHGNGPYETHGNQVGCSSRGEERQTVGSAPPYDAHGNHVHDSDGNPAGTHVRSPDGTYVSDTDHSTRDTSENEIREELGFKRRGTYYPKRWPGGPPW